MQKKKILLIGDACLDIFVEGRVSRISPEAPVPVFSYLYEKSYPGCAANVALSLTRLGLEVDLLCFIADDEDGEILLNKLNAEGVNTEYVIRARNNSKIFTAVKKRIVSESHHICRIDKEPSHKEIKSISSGFFEKNLNQAISKNEYTFTVISDYAKGIISKESYSLINKFSKSPIIVDPKPINKIDYKNAFIPKPNKKEILDLANVEIDPSNEDISELKEPIFEFIYKNNIENLIVTDGINGSYLINIKEIQHFPSEKVEVYDVSGAGDSFLAALVFCCSENKNLIESVKFANMAASTTIIHSGTTPLLKKDILKINE